jgi:hypothetical protein
MSSFFSRKAVVPEQFHLAAIRSIAPTPYVSGAELDEPEGLGYQRLVLPNNTDFWSNAGQIQVSLLNSNAAYAPATGDWGTLRHWALCNAAVDGYVYFTGSLESPVTILNGDTLMVGAGDLSVTVGPFFTSEDA